jgi:hypothetical protein
VSGARSTIRRIYDVPAGAIMLIVALPFVLLARMFHGRSGKPAILFGAASIASLPALARALRAIGFEASAAAVAGPGMPEPVNFDRVVTNPGRRSRLRRSTLGYVESLAAFIWSINRFDVFCLFFSGGLLRKTPLPSSAFPTPRGAKFSSRTIPRWRAARPKPNGACGCSRPMRIASSLVSFILFACRAGTT